MSLDIAALNAIAKQVPDDPAALRDGCRYTVKPDPEDARFQVITIRSPSPVLVGGVTPDVDKRGDEAARAFLQLCVDTAQAIPR